VPYSGFNRYKIVSERDLADAAKKLEISCLVTAAPVDEQPEAAQNETIQ
jgi:hypothetical protein